MKVIFDFREIEYTDQLVIFSIVLDKKKKICTDLCNLKLVWNFIPILIFDFLENGLSLDGAADAVDPAIKNEYW